MAELLIKFETRLTDHDSKSQVKGLAFHRWLPNGSEDAIVLNERDDSCEIKVWFERLGVADNGFIQYKENELLSDHSLIESQAIIDSGPLCGLIILRNISTSERLINESEDNEDYHGLAKRVVQILFYPKISKFIELMRTNLGQYWILPLEEWDSKM